jgi:hypothetical protein
MAATAGEAAIIGTVWFRGVLPPNAARRPPPSLSRKGFEPHGAAASQAAVSRRTTPAEGPLLLCTARPQGISLLLPRVAFTTVVKGG